MIDSWILDWLNVGFRWVHLIAGIGWIGTSLYFMWLDAALIRADPPRGDVEGHTWLLHSGGFYLVERRKLPPGQLPSPIHWFKWEAAMTWLTGFPLLVLVYYMTGGVYLVDPSVSSITQGHAVILGISALVGASLHRRVRADPRAERPGGVHPHGRAARDDHGGQRLDAHRAGAARSDRGRRGGPHAGRDAL